MNKKKIIIDKAIPDLERRLTDHFEVISKPGANIDGNDVKDAAALIVRTRTHCDRQLLADSSVSLVATATIGTDHINMRDMADLGIEVCNAPGCNAPGVAQYVWSSLLTLGFDPSRHTLGVVGKGHVGSIVTQWGRTLGCNVLVCDPPRRDAGYSDEEYLSLDRLASACDAVTFHVPLTHDAPYATARLCNDETMKLLKPGAILINASRGGVVHEEALLRHIAGRNLRAVIDTWIGEPAINTALLESAEIATPHIAGYTREGKSRATRMVLEAVGRHFNVTLPTEGLTGNYTPPTALTVSSILQSYDPHKDTQTLRGHPLRFETLRTGYQLRDEVE
ncbi:MAG: 4-phosphoerythronate dehydrogenase [Muribaculum sp.]|nr:4-phosphoerythronate dehydrogenase [Muribaculum sp.]